MKWTTVMASDDEDVRIEGTVTFRPAGEWLAGKRLDDQTHGRVGELVDVERSRPGAMLPPHPVQEAPTSTLAQRMRERLARGD
ncbi:MAG: hypothetical protein NVSMB64_27640 [Candidatus Velthaea sp.]